MPTLADELSVLLGAVGVQQGWQDTFQLPAVGAGVGIMARQVAGVAWERVLVAKVRLVTDAVVGNRFLAAQILDGDGNILHTAQASGAVAAATTLDCWFAVGGMFAQGTAGNANAPIPDLILPSGWTFQFQAFGLDAGDQLSNARVLVQRFPTSAVRATAD